MVESLEIRIVELLSRDLDSLYSIADIAKRLKVAYSHAHLFVNRLVDSKILVTQKVGRTIVCRLNLKNPLTLSKLAEIEYAKVYAWSKKDPRSSKIFERIQLVKDKVHTVLLQNNKVVLLVPENAGGDFSIFKNRAVLTVFEMRKNAKFYEKALVLYGAEKYWSLIKDA